LSVLFRVVIQAGGPQHDAKRRITLPSLLLRLPLLLLLLLLLLLRASAARTSGSLPDRSSTSIEKRVSTGCLRAALVGRGAGGG